MLSFDILNEESADGITASLARKLGDAEMTEGIIASFLEIVEDGAEVAVSAECGMLLIRIYDEGRYSFVYPIEVAEDTDADAALSALAEYTVKEMIPFYLTDVPRESLPELTRLFSHVDARAYAEDEDSFVAIVYSECDMLDEPPVISHGGVTLSAITERDIAPYERLCLSDVVNAYWGYSVREDNPDADGEYFLRVAESELSRGVAVTLAVREGGVESPLIGEAVLHGFDYRGGAVLALRLLPEYWGRGLGGKTLDAIFKLARDMRLKTLYAEVMTQNEASMKMIERRMDRVESDGEKVRFAASV